jgi:hypothetical protein
MGTDETYLLIYINDDYLLSLEVCSMHSMQSFILIKKRKKAYICVYHEILYISYFKTEI